MPGLTHREVEDLLYREAALLDEQRFEEWIELYTKDCIYWIPSVQGNDPNKEAAILYDERTTLEDRIIRLRNPAAHAQSPSSRTVHMITNVRIESASDEEMNISSLFNIYEVRTGVQRSHAGKVEHGLRRVDNEWRIALKKIWLVNRDIPLYNLAFLF